MTAPTRRRRALCVAVRIAVAAAPLPAAAQGSDALGRAMRDELARSMKELRLDQLERPYFIAYRVREMHEVDASASQGSLLHSDSARARGLDVEVRVGDYAFDNTNFFGEGGFGMVAIGRGALRRIGGGELPLDDDYREIRRALWLATDADYKQALEIIAAKRAARLNRSRGDSLPDFTREAATQTTDETRPITVSRADVEALARELSGIREVRRLHYSQVDVSAHTVRLRFFNSEGTSAVRTRPRVTVFASGSTQAADGLSMSGAMRFFARSLDELPARDALVRAVRSLALQLDSLRSAPVLERYNGPVLFAGRAAAELFAEVFGPALVGQRPMSGEPEFARAMQQMGMSDESFTDKIGRRVLPAFLSVIDDPTIAEQGGVPLLGSYRVDDDGVPGRRKTLVENGVLKSLLTTRTPIEGVAQSSGNRRGEGAAPSNLIVQATRAVGEVELKAQLLELVKQRGLPYGILVRELGTRTPAMQQDVMRSMMFRRGAGGVGRPVFRAYRVYPDGREQLVRGARLGDLDVQSFRDVVAASSAPTVYHRFVASRGRFPMPMMWMMEEGGGWHLPVASYVVPSLLFEDATFLKPPVEQPKPPLSPPP